MKAFGRVSVVLFVAALSIAASSRSSTKEGVQKRGQGERNAAREQVVVFVCEHAESP